jgi:hypothetical protein
MHILIKQLEEDCKQYDALFSKYQRLKSDDFSGAWEISQTALVLADRWNDINLCANQLAQTEDYKKSELSQWAYGRYMLLRQMHEKARMVWNKGESDARDIERMERWAQKQAQVQAIRRGE